mgnify:CR=1 FL=1
MLPTSQRGETNSGWYVGGVLTKHRVVGVWNIEFNEGGNRIADGGDDVNDESMDGGGSEQLW